jgi:hypothetical protein
MSLIDEARGVRQRIAERLRELEPMVREYNELRKLAAEMGVGEEETVPASTEPAPPSPSRRARATRSGRRRGGAGTSRTGATRASGGGGEASELEQRVLEAVRAQPGKTVAEYSEIVGLAPTALYRPVRELTTAGALVKRARQLFPAEG